MSFLFGEVDLDCENVRSRIVSMRQNFCVEKNGVSARGGKRNSSKIEIRNEEIWFAKFCQSCSSSFLAGKKYPEVGASLFHCSTVL